MGLFNFCVLYSLLSPALRIFIPGLLPAFRRCLSGNLQLNMSFDYTSVLNLSIRFHYLDI